MNRFQKPSLVAFTVTLLQIAFSGSELAAGQHGLFTYEIVGNEITITDYPESETGGADIPTNIDGKRVTAIGDEAFFFCRVGSITIPRTVTRIGRSAFGHCGNLTGVTIPFTVITIDDWAFENCYQLTSVVIEDMVPGPSKLTGIGYGAFRSCSNLTSINLPGSITAIGGEAFGECHSLTSITLPGGVSTISFGTFQGCTGMTRITIPASVISIGDWAFGRCYSLTGIVIPSAVTSIGEHAFVYCENLDNFTIPANVTTIGPSAFRDCRSLISIHIPANLTSIGFSAFGGCGSLTAITVDPFNPVYDSADGILYGEGHTALIQCPGGKAGSVVIPPGVTDIHPAAFRGCGNLTSVTIPSSVSIIGSSAFGNCGSMAMITVDPLNLAYSSIEGVLYNKGRNLLIQCPGGKAGNFSIPAGVTEIGALAFSNCTSLTGDLTVPSGVTAIEDYTFFNCAGLTGISIPDSMTRIGSYAFSQCSHLGSINMPASVASVGVYAFYSCSSLKSLVFEGNAPVAGNPLFFGVAPGFSTYFYKGSTGFTSPTWRGFPAVEIDRNAYPAASWLLSYGFGYDTGLNQDVNGDGVKLLMAYALNLNPHRNQAASIPGVTHGPETMSMRFYGISPGIIYRVEKSADLKAWVTDGVSIEPPDSEGIRTATVEVEGTHLFVRLAVEK